MCDREQPRDLVEHGKEVDGRCCARAHGWTELAQEQDLRRLAGLISTLPVPGALGVRATERVCHCSTQTGGIDGAAAFEVLEELVRGREEGVSFGGRGGRNGADDSVKLGR